MDLKVHVTSFLNQHMWREGMISSNLNRFVFGDPPAYMRHLQSVVKTDRGRFFFVTESGNMLKPIAAAAASMLRDTLRLHFYWRTIKPIGADAVDPLFGSVMKEFRKDEFTHVLVPFMKEKVVSQFTVIAEPQPDPYGRDLLWFRMPQQRFVDLVRTQTDRHQ